MATPETIASEGIPDPDKPTLKGGGKQVVKLGDMKVVNDDFDRLAPKGRKSAARCENWDASRWKDGHRPAVQRAHTRNSVGWEAGVQAEVQAVTTFIGDHVPNPSAFDTYNRFRSYLKVEDAFCAFFGREFLAQRGWRAVVVSEELTSQEAHDIAVACKQVGYKTATALDIDHFDSGLFYKIQLDAKTLSKLEETFLTPSYLVVEEQERFMLVSDGDYYWSIASSPLFLQRCFDRPLDVVDQEFIDETRTYRDGRSRIGRSLSRIACETLGLPLSAA